jgi:hypothetical protein
MIFEDAGATLGVAYFPEWDRHATAVHCFAAWHVRPWRV